MPKRYLKSFYWRDYLNITIGLTLYAIGLIGFIRPGDIVTGGLTGIALLVEYSTKFPLQYTYFIVNCILLGVGYKILGGKFLAKTVYAVFVLTGLLTVCRAFITEPILEGEPILAGVIGGMLCGSGIGLVFGANGSTGGTDIVIAIINKYKSMSMGRGMLLIDFIIISSSYFIFHDMHTIITGLIVMGVMTYSIDMVINGFRQSVQFLIISSKYDIIADAINKEMHRGCTMLDGVGWYTKKPTKVIMVLARRAESIQIFRLVQSIDDKAFISQSTVRGVYGEGFDKIKT